MSKKSCVFCAIVAGTKPCHKVWEDKDHLAFLSIYPNTEGVTIVVTKKHFSSNVFNLSERVYIGLMKASRTVIALINKHFPDVGRTGMIIEGFGIDHAHTKLYPMHGTKMKKWRPILSEKPTYCEKYDGLLTSADGPLADEMQLKKLAESIRASEK